MELDMKIHVDPMTGEEMGHSAEIEKRFRYHAPTPPQVETYDKLRIAFKQVAYLIELNCPGSREQALAMTNLEQAMMWANASIARRSGSNE